MKTLVVAFLMLVMSCISAQAKSCENYDGYPHGNHQSCSFNAAKKTLFQIYNDHKVEFYCGAKFDDDEKVIDPNGFTTSKYEKSKNEIDWDHLVAAESFGQSFLEWREGHSSCIDSKENSFKGRKCAEKVSILYRHMQADLYNLVPALAPINRLRSNYSFEMITGNNWEFGTCQVKIEDRKIEPPAQTRGFIARTFKYMDWAYPGHGIISGKNQKLFDAWDRQYPVSQWEATRAKRIEQIQGNEDPFVKLPAKKLGIW